MEGSRSAIRDGSIVDVRAAIGATPLGAMHYRLASLIGLVVLFDGYDTLNASYVIHYVKGPWDLTDSQSGFIVSSGLIGFLVGAIAQGPLADRLGRRAVLIGGLWISAAFTIATALFATNFMLFCSLRILTGLGLGALLPAGITYINEIAPNRIKSLFSVWGWLLGWVLGGMAAAAAGILLTPRFGWQALYFFGSLSCLIAIACQRFLPESPAYSALRGDARAVSVFLRRFDPAHAKKYENARFVLAEESRHAGSFGLLMSPRYRRTTISVCLASFCCLFATFGLTGWLPTVLLNRGDGFVASFGSGALLLVMSLIGGLGTGAIADRLHRDRTLMVVSLIAGAGCILALTFVQGVAADLFFVSGAGLFILGAQVLLNNFTAASYDTEVRSTAIGTMLGIGRLGAIAGPLAGGVLQQRFAGANSLFCAISLAAICGALSIVVAKAPMGSVRDAAPATAPSH